MKNLYILEPKDTENTVGNRESAFLKRISISSSDLSTQGWSDRRRQRFAGKGVQGSWLLYDFGGKNGHLSVHPQQTGIGKRPKNGLQQPPRKEGGNDLTLGFQLSKQK